MRTAVSRISTENGCAVADGLWAVICKKDHSLQSTGLSAEIEAVLIYLPGKSVAVPLALFVHIDGSGAKKEVAELFHSVSTLSSSAC